MPRLTRTEVTQALRALRLAPWYASTLAAVIALSMALGATVFAIVDGALFKPLPYRDASGLFAVSGGHSKLAEPFRRFASISPAEFHEWQASLPDVRMTAFLVGDSVTVGMHDSPVGARVDATFFDVIGMWPVVGGFEPADFQTATPIRPAIVTHDFWATRLGRDPAAIGKTMTDDTGRGIRVAGVLPEGFVFPFPNGKSFVPELLTPLVEAMPRSTGGSRIVLMRSAARVPPADIERRLTVAAGQWAAAHPPAPRPGASARTEILRRPYDRIGLQPIGAALTSELSGKAWTVFTAAAVLMLLASLNAASLAIARVRNRWRQLAVRRALGATFGDLARAIAVENAIVIGCGAALGLVTARPLLDITTRLIGGGFLVALKTPRIDARVILFGLFGAILSVALVTWLSARAGLRASLRPAMSDGAGTTRRQRRGRVIVATQLALAVTIVIAGALVAGSLMRVWGEDPGFASHDAAVIEMSPPPGASAAEIEALVGAIGRLPGVRSAGATAHPLLEHAFNGSGFDRPSGIPPEQLGAGFPIEDVPVTHGYFTASGLPIRDGRAPTDEEFAGGAAVIVVSDTVVREYWPGGHAVGQTLKKGAREYAVVGVVPDARFMALDLDAQGEIYWPVAAMGRPSAMNVIVRTDGAAGATVGTVTAAVRHLCPACWVMKADTLDDLLAETITPRRFSAWLFSAFALAALIIVGVGVLGLVAMTTGARTREIGIRMALGATRWGVIRQLAGEQMVATAIGLGAGAIASGWLVGFLTSYLYKTSTYDVRLWAAAIAALFVVALAGAIIPSVRASRIEPAKALRVE